MESLGVLGLVVGGVLGYLVVVVVAVALFAGFVLARLLVGVSVEGEKVLGF